MKKVEDISYIINNIKIKELIYLITVRIPTTILGLWKGNLIYVHWGRIGKNFGDCLSPIILKHYGFTPVFSTNNDKSDIVIAGTLLQWLDKDYDGFIVGVGGDDKKYNFHKAKILALRGKLTQRNMENIEKNVVLADPGLLIPLIYDSTQTKYWKLGIIPHFVDFEHPSICSLKEKLGEECKIINVRRDPKDVINDITSCQYIVSSSLHGLIIADAYAIPNKRIVIRETMPAYFYDYKFDDYYSIYDYKHVPLELSEDTSIEYLLSECKVIDPKIIKKKIYELDNVFKNLKYEYLKRKRKRKR